ncbi:MAG: M23 family metallopeptidase [Anditalea sp.]
MKKWIIIAVVLISGCNGGVVDKLLKKSSPYEDYLSSLESTPLSDYAFVKDWKTAGESVLDDSLQITLPYHEIGYFDPRETTAMLLRYPVEEGNQIDLALHAVSQKDAKFFMDVFELDIEDQTMERIHFADSSGTISYRVKDSGIHALRVQPELFRGGAFALGIAYQGILAFPILGNSTSNIASFWGDPRDGDARKHEGIDIFASRGTPVVAASSGRVRRVGDNRLGGKVVWLSNNQLGYSQYYAHLDSQLVQSGQQVDVGDTLGLVGNTGNAITTAPHLHFGIYKSGRGAVDPFPFLQGLSLPDETDIADSTHLGTPAIIKASLANIRTSPSTASEIIGSFDQNTLLKIEGKSGDWYRISLPNNQKGYIYKNLAEKIEAPIKEVELNPLDEIWEFWQDSDPIAGDIISGKAQVFGEFKNNYYLETSTGIKGWWRIK